MVLGMIKRYSVILAIVFLLCISNAKALAWGKEGHVLTAGVAEQMLTSKTKKELAKLGFDTIATSEVANYADRVRRNKDYPQYSRSGPWHFIDLSVEQNLQTVEDIDKFVEQHKYNVVWAINHFADTLKDSKASKADKQEAVKFLVHFVGDVHQPLHCATRHNDHGGNLVSVHYFHSKAKVNLHHVWDTNLVLDACGSKHPDLQAVAKQWYTDLDISHKMSMMKPSDAKGWALESYRIAKKYAYGEESPVHSGDTLSENYVTDGKYVVKVQIQKGGLRLATLLNGIFDK